MAFKASSHLAEGSRGGLKNGDKQFWGERIRGSLNNSVWGNQWAKSLRADKNVNKTKPAVAVAVLTSSNAKEAVVS